MISLALRILFIPMPRFRGLRLVRQERADAERHLVYPHAPF